MLEDYGDVLWMSYRRQGTSTLTTPSAAAYVCKVKASVGVVTRARPPFKVHAFDALHGLAAITRDSLDVHAPAPLMASRG